MQRVVAWRYLLAIVCVFIHYRHAASALCLHTDNLTRLELIDFGTQYTTQTHSREVVIENRGRQPRKLVWTLELLGIWSVLRRDWEAGHRLHLFRSEETKKKDRKTPTKEKSEEGVDSSLHWSVHCVTTFLSKAKLASSPLCLML